MLERLCLEKLKERKGPRQGFGISFSPSTEAKKNTHSDTGRPPSPSEKLTNQEDINELKISQLVVSSRYLYLPPITTLSTLLQPFLDGRSAQKHCNSQPLTTRQKKFRKVPLTSDRGTTRPKKKCHVKATLHSSTSCEDSCRSGLHARCAKEHKHEILNIVFTYLLGRKHAVLNVTLRYHNFPAACLRLLDKEEDKLRRAAHTSS